MLIDPNKLALPPATAPAQAAGQRQAKNSLTMMPVLGGSKQAIAVSDARVQMEGKLVDPSEQGVKSASPDDLRRTVSEANEYIQSFRRDLSLNYDEESQSLVIKVIDRDTEEVVRQIPPDEVLSFIRNMLRMEENREGVLLKEKA